MKQIIYNNEIALKTKYDGYYATKSGKIITVKVKGGQGTLDYSNPREHSYKIDKDGYLEVCLSLVENNKHKRVYRRVHRVIWETFNGDILNNLTIDHIDTNKQNNSIDNLRLLTRGENSRIARTGKEPGIKGKKFPHRNKYKLYIKNEFIGIFDKKELIENYNITRHSIDIVPKRSTDLIKRDIVLEKM